MGIPVENSIQRRVVFRQGLSHILFAPVPLTAGRFTASPVAEVANLAEPQPEPAGAGVAQRVTGASV